MPTDIFYKLNLNEIKRNKPEKNEQQQTKQASEQTVWLKFKICNHEAHEAINIFDRFNNPRKRRRTFKNVKSHQTLKGWCTDVSKCWALVTLF